MSSTTIKEQFSTYKRFIRWFWIIFGSGSLLVIIFILLLSAGVFGALPSFEELENPQSNLATQILTSDGELLGRFYRENRTNATYDEIPPFLIDALVSTEDRRFYEHSGIDAKSVMRVIFKTILLHQEESGGGSTLTQQLAKNLYGRPVASTKFELGLIKFKEWITAAKLERRYTKEEIIVMYLNTIPYIYDASGVKTAAKTFFNKSIQDISVEEAAVLVGMVQNPSFYNPVRFPDRCRDRRNIVLHEMHEANKLSDEDYQKAKESPLVLNFKRQDHKAGSGTYFREYLRQWLADWVEENPKPDGGKWDIYKDGLKIYTTIDSRMQAYAEQASQEWLTKLQTQFDNHWKGNKYEPWAYPYSGRTNPELINKAMKQTDRYRGLKKAGKTDAEIDKIFHTPDSMTVFSWKSKNYDLDTIMSPYDSIKYVKKMLQPGFMAMDPHTGGIKAWVGGIDMRYFQLDHVKPSHGRQVGSTFKPFVYTAAIADKGFSPCYQIPNLPVSFEKGEKWGLLSDWTPKNSDGHYGGMLTLSEGLGKSVNTVTAFLLREVGIQPVIDLSKNMGIESEIPYQPSICLGTPEVTVYEMTAAYSAFANKGVAVRPVFVTRIEDKNGNIIAEFPAKRVEVMREEVASVMLNMMEYVVNSGTGQRIRRPEYGGITSEVAGKTGTTQENTDGWFMGMVPQLVCGTWVGADDPVVHFRSTALGQGANMALPIYGLFMKRVYADKTLGIDPNAHFPAYEGTRTIELDCGKYRDNQRNDYQDLMEGYN
ncbi:MAG TPA: transglycosylase domain-containing protein [Chitinophagales bacterium]|nr:transglycosylase domain-containing protein [Chitinophagales bacterium]HMX03248.1 transglycosylase domain-containing protein [Chitinophagales bacterium]HMZ89090.1 transglycosylase domain-containing protein [Chitinophagales bacterium]HNA56614.1 transglycosylase domain-containing protein [Chitinophagales bacterium]HNE45390.1 transglycosylase domain-containing protein [Chitinophagales bacterium]